MEDKRYVGLEEDEIRIQPSQARPGWIYVMIYHATMNPDAARDAARRLIEIADEMEKR